MGRVVIAPTKLTLEEVTAAIAFRQPKLRARRDGSAIQVEGSYLVFEPGSVANPAGPISEFEIKIVVTPGYPGHEPAVFELAGRIPREPSRHINHNGTCCVTVWEHWLASASDHSFAAFLNGPLNEYFLGQYSFETTGKWPFGERSHGKAGLEEAYADALGIPNNKRNLIYHLRLLAKDWPKGHWLCPCRSGRILRQCHHNELMAFHHKISPNLARRMLKRLNSIE